MRLIGALLLTLSAVTPASSVYVIVPGIIQQAGTGALLSLAGGAMTAIAMAFVYAELASAFPIAGGEYSMIGRALGPWAGFLIMAVSGVNTTVATAALAVGTAPYLESIAPGLDPIATGIAVNLGATVLGVLNIRTNAWITGLFLLTEVAALVVLGYLGFGHASRPISDLILTPLTIADGQLVPASLSAIALGMTVAAFAYNGFGAAIYFAEEMHEAPKLIARTILWALALTVLLEFIPVAAVLIGAEDLTSLLSATNPFTAFVLARGGQLLDMIIGLAVAVAIANAVLATVLMNARFLFATGRDNVWWNGANQSLTRIHDRFHSPWIATLWAGFASALACFIPFPMLLVLNGTGVIIVYLFLCWAALSGRRTGKTDHGHYKMPGHRLFIWSAISTLVSVTATNWLDPEIGRPSLLVTAALMAATGAYYYFVLRRRGSFVLRGPDEPISEPAIAK
jgi:amino acid transporter